MQRKLIIDEYLCYINRNMCNKLGINIQYHLIN